MLDYVDEKPLCKRYLPIEKEVYKLPRQYLANLIHSVKGENFQMWVDKRVKERNEKIKSEQNLLITLDPDVARVFNNSESFSGKYSLTKGVNFDFLTFFSSLQGQVLELDEGYVQEETHEVVDQGREVCGGAQADGDPREAGCLP